MGALILDNELSAVLHPSHEIRVEPARSDGQTELAGLAGKRITEYAIS